jgi:hypothetical protein
MTSKLPSQSVGAYRRAPERYYGGGGAAQNPLMQ